MKIKESLECPKCNGTHFAVKHEATYLYTYNLETPDTGDRSRFDESFPFLFDNRELVESKEYLECEQCGAKYPCDIDRKKRHIQYTILQKAIRADHQTNPEFLG
ncbi:MAG: hypothetical protein ACM3TR_02640 [Caulobacteraceae bacterium]